MPHAPGGIQTRHLSNQTAAGPRLCYRDHRSQLLQVLHFNIFICVAKYSLHLFVSLSIPYIYLCR